jgi:hypothetical protein
MRRYAYVSILGIVADEDEDNNIVDSKSFEKTNKPNSPESKGEAKSIKPKITPALFTKAVANLEGGIKVEETKKYLLSLDLTPEQQVIIDKIGGK